MLSDYTFAVQDGEALLNIGKAYSGLTDNEIREYTAFFLQHTLEDQGYRRIVEPKIVLEVAFNNIQKSRRHNSGYALRFPRIVRIRRDKPVSDRYPGDCGETVCTPGGEAFENRSIISHTGSGLHIAHRENL